MIQTVWDYALSCWKMNFWVFYKYGRKKPSLYYQVIISLIWSLDGTCKVMLNLEECSFQISRLGSNIFLYIISDAVDLPGILLLVLFSLQIFFSFLRRLSILEPVLKSKLDPIKISIKNIEIIFYTWSYFIQAALKIFFCRSDWYT